MIKVISNDLIVKIMKYMDNHGSISPCITVTL